MLLQAIKEEAEKIVSLNRQNILSIRIMDDSIRPDKTYTDNIRFGINATDETNEMSDYIADTFTDSAFTYDTDFSCSFSGGQLIYTKENGFLC